MAALVLLNGPPGAGKSALARRWAAERPGLVVVDIDELRSSISGWRDDRGTMAASRELALEQVRSHLAAGRDVVVPQYLGRLPYVEALAEVAVACGARFVEVVLRADADVCAEQFRHRRASLAASGTAHPEADVSEDQIEAVIADAIERLADVLAARPGTVVVDADADAAANPPFFGT